MTTVVFDGQMLATDSQATRGLLDGSHCPSCADSIVSIHTFKNKLTLGRPHVKFQDQRVLAWAGAGAVPAIEALTMALQKNMDLNQAMQFAHKLSGKDNASCGHNTCTMLVITDVSCWRLELGKTIVVVKEVTEFPVVIGSGQLAAKFAMRWLGLTAFGGVAAAADVDKSTSGKINWYMCRPAEGEELAKEVQSDEYTTEEFKSLMDERISV